MDLVNQIRGIMFDMDNTLLRSHINFQAMKKEIAAFLMQRGHLPENFSTQEHSSSTIMELAKLNGISKEDEEAMMNIAVHYEVLGMNGAGLEAGVIELLETLTSKYILVIVTNNSRQAAYQALDLTGIKDYFDFIVGREQMEALKPSPSGYLTAKQQFPQLMDHEWISIGDSWIDGKASFEANIPFISYGANRNVMKEKGINPIAHLDHILSLLNYV
jgi:phosphoglycolate phosphatase